MALEIPYSRTFKLGLMGFGILAVVIVLAALSVRPPRHVTIGVGPIGGSFHQTALKYQKVLATRGIDLVIRSRANSLDILSELEDPKSGLDVGFEAQDVTQYLDGRLTNLGRIELQPLFIFAAGKLGRRTVLTDLRGRRIVMPPMGSATSDAAIRMFKLYDISSENTFFTFLPLTEAARRLRAGEFDAGAFMLSPDNKSIREMALDSGLRLMPVPEAKAVSDHLPFLRPVIIPRGIYDIADGIPPVDTGVLAGRVNVVVREGLHPFVIYALLDAMAEVHKGATYISEPGAYPTIVGSELNVHPLATHYTRFGVPWVYDNLPAWPASFIERYFVFGVAFVILILVYATAKYLLELVGALIGALAITCLVRIDRSAARTGTLTPLQKVTARFAERILSRPADEGEIQRLLARLRARTADNT
jgi:TRAP-type uncharacterized transport system substrate-binding protein